MDNMVNFLLTVFGLVIGSFLNVLIYRLPRGESFVLPPSHCPACNHRLGFFDLIPVFSYLFLKGRCRYCQTYIHWRYPLVESISAGITVIWWLRMGQNELTVENGIWLALSYLLIVIAFIDIDLMIIPNRITIPVIIIGLTYKALVGELFYALYGMLAGGGILALFAILYSKGMGWGDVKFLAMTGIFLGWEKVIFSLFLGSFIGLIVVGILMGLKKIDRKSPFAFGPYLVIATLIMIYCSVPIFERFF